MLHPGRVSNTHVGMTFSPARWAVQIGQDTSAGEQGQVWGLLTSGVMSNQLCPVALTTKLSKQQAGKGFFFLSS